MIKAVIFDCFGVLQIDAEQSFLEQHPDHRAELLQLRAQADVGLLDRLELLAGFSEVTGIAPDAIDRTLRSEHALNKPLLGCIQILRERGVAIGMLSNLGRGWFNEFFPEGAVRDLFDDIIISGEVGMAKPQPEIYQLALERLGIEPKEAVFVDDRESNCEGARAVGMAAIFYQDFEQFKVALGQLKIQ